MTSLRGVRQMQLLGGHLVVVFSPSLSSPFSLCRQEDYCHLIEQSPEALRCLPPLMRAPLGTISSRFMKLSGRVNAVAVQPPFTGNRDNKSVRHCCTLSPRGGFSLTDCWVCWWCIECVTMFNNSQNPDFIQTTNKSGKKYPT